MYCNFLLEIEDDDEVDNTTKTKAEDLFVRRKCDLGHACSYCYTPPGPPSNNEQEQKCTNTKPWSCPVEQEESQGGKSRRKRQAPNGPESVKGPTQQNVDFDSEARFVRKIMELVPEYRLDIFKDVIIYFDV